MSKLGICIAVLVGMVGSARAQAPQDTPSVEQQDVEIEDAAPDTAPPPAAVSPYDQCMAFRKSIAAQAASATNLDERTRLYRSMPECHRDEPVAAPTVMPQPVQAPAVGPDDLLESEIPELRSPTTAVLMSLGTTAVGYGLVIGASNPTLVATGAVMALVGPTTGHFYAGDYWNAGLGCRLLGIGATFVGGVTIFASEGDSTAGGALVVGGGLLYLGGAVYEIATAGRAARAYNREAAVNSLKVAPMVSHQTTGLSLVGRF